MKDCSSAEASDWVERTLAGLTLEQAVGQILCPAQYQIPEEEWPRVVRDLGIGSLFFSKWPALKVRETAEAVAEAGGIPPLITSDFEHGAGVMIPECVNFPWFMAAGAAGDLDLVERMGEATAIEARALGAHWTLGPVCDINSNWRNPVVNIRSFGDDAEKVAGLCRAYVRGVQKSGLMAACAKHFPGDGSDWRDQHLCTSTVSMTVPQWKASHGKVWKAVIDEDVYSVMSGHLSFPDFVGLPEQDALPATIDPLLQVRLLRETLGFRGLVVSDALPMIGLCSRVPWENAAVEFVRAGGDVVLFAEREDHGRLLKAVHSGHISENRLHEAVRRVLEMKAKLGIHRQFFGPKVTQEQRSGFERASCEMAERSMTLIKPGPNTPVYLERGDHVVLACISQPNPKPSSALFSDLTPARLALEERGYRVTHLVNAGRDAIAEAASSAKASFIGICITPHNLIGTISPVGDAVMHFWHGILHHLPNAIFTSFGSPYLLAEQPHLPNLYLAYGISPDSQRAAVRAWLGEIQADAVPPVRMEY
jgi:beta-N-acetylhexosaminidase